VRFARLVFFVAGAWGLLVLTPLYFLFDAIGRQHASSITYPQFFYGFVSVAMAWQVAFLVIASDPVRFRPMMIPSVIEKLWFIASMTVLYLQARVGFADLMVTAPDLVWGVLFLLAFTKTATASLHDFHGFKEDTWLRSR